MAETEHPPQTEEPAGFRFSIWPPTQRIRDAVVQRLTETQTSPSVLSGRYGTVPIEEASETASRVEEEAFICAGSFFSPDNEGMQILRVYSKEISKRMLDAVKARSDATPSTEAENRPSESLAVALEQTEKVSSFQLIQVYWDLILLFMEVVAQVEALAFQTFPSELPIPRGSVREEALAILIDEFKKAVLYEFAQNLFITVTHRCENSLKRGSALEIDLALQLIGLLAITVGAGDNAHEIYEESLGFLPKILKFKSSHSIKVFECLAIVTFVGAKNSDETERSMEIIWKFINEESESKGSDKKITLTICETNLTLTTFSLVKQINYLKEFLGDGFVDHMRRISKSPSSYLSKGRTQLRNKHRMIAQEAKLGEYRVDQDFVYDGY
ncbi:Interferon- developmental regulator 1 [Datura stramonium]|uniref:Interferon- developmental regulator 1 n=1 Tax=Datura stramonium TaxID=4076 RepID=A0ABS8TIR3_DATST|nr:Interferon- developmental regulator 1 [Datura stramonium]